MVLGYRGTSVLRQLLTVVKRDLEYTGRLEHYVSYLLVVHGDYFQEIEMTTQTMGNHIDAVIKGLSPALKEEEYRTVEACLAGEAEKLGMQYRFDYIHQRFAFSLRRPSGEHSNCRGEGAPRDRQGQK